MALADYLECIAVVHLGVSLFAVAAEVVIDAAAAKDGPGATIVQSHLGRQQTDGRRALDEDGIAGEERMVLLNDRLELIEERGTFLQPAARQVGRCAAGRE